MISDQGTRDYYESVEAVLPDVHAFYRFFPVPGLAHCFGGKSGQPLSLFDQLRAWVENGTAPDSTPVEFSDANGVVQNRILCPYPQSAKLDTDCGNTTKAECFSCQ